MKFLKNIFMSCIIMCIQFNILQATHPTPEATFTGIADATFTNPSGGGVSTGVGTNFFTWGDGYTYSGPSSLRFTGKSFKVTTPSGYILGTNAQKDRPTFSIGTLEYYNGDVKSGTYPAGVRLDTNIRFLSPIETETTTFLAHLSLVSTLNLGHAEDNADYVYFPNSIAPVIVSNANRVNITVKPMGFGKASSNGFIKEDQFHVLELQTASTEVLAQIIPPCQSIVNGAVKTWISDDIDDYGKVVPNTASNAIFIPNFKLSLNEAAKLCGYDHFNWVQYVLDDPKPGMYTAKNPTKLLKGPYLDPPIGGYSTQIDDSLPYFWGENGPTVDELKDMIPLKTKLEFWDAPQDFRLIEDDTVKFVTALVGVLSNNKYDMLYVWNWESNYNGGSGEASIRKKSISHVSAGGTGGAHIIKRDLTADEISLSVRRLMQRDGARNIDVPAYMDLLPLPLLYNVLFD